MKKTKKALASLAIASMILSTVPFNAFAAGTVPTRLSGNTAAQTAVAIADQTGWTGTAILASSTSYGMVDALTAGPLASYLKAPILLTGAESTLDAATKAELTKLAVKTVYVTSGTAVIKQSVLDELVAMGITVTPLGGIDRAATSVNIASKMVGVTKVAVANGLQDALSIAAIASAANEPILLTDKGALPDSVKAFLTANPGITSSDVIGGTGIISDAVKAALPGATRHAGVTAYDTNNQLIQDFASSLTFGNVYVANGVTGIDALAGAPLAAQTKSAIVLTDGTVPAAATFVHGKLATGAVVTALGGAAVVSESVRTSVVTGVVTPPAGALSVTSVSAVSATSFKVVFNQAPADTTKVTFAVARATTPVTVSATWNAAKTEATVTSSTNFPEGSYTVAVKNDTTDLGTSTVAVTAQKIAKINITSTKLAVTTTGGAIQTGYASYNVLDQYGNDITTTSLANNLHFQSGVTNGDIYFKNGLLTLTPNVANLMQFSSVVITGYDNTSGVSTTATLTTSTQVGSLNDLQLTTLTNVDNKVLTAGDSTSVFYAGYTATDISGNPTTSYNLVRGGLILNNSDVTLPDQITTSNTNVIAQLVQDPNDSNKALIQVKVKSGTVLSMDMPVTITTMTWTGKTSSLNVTLKKASTVDSVTLMVPSYDIAVNDTKDIPFSAIDQNGVAMTKATDLTSPAVVFSTNVTPVTNVDGTLRLSFSPTTKGSQTITAMTSTGKYSSININVVDAAVANTLTLDTSVLVSSMQSGAVQGIDYGATYGGLAVKDQYGRVMDLQKDTSLYEVVATASGAINASGIATGVAAITLTAGATGPGTVTFKLVPKSNPTTATPLDQKSVTFGVVANTDIKGYTIDTVKDPILTTTTSGAVTLQSDSYSANPKIYGTTASGSKVVLANCITNTFVDSTDFGIDTVNGSLTSYDSVYVYAKPLANNVTSSSTNLTVVFTGADGAIKSLSTPIKSTTASPTASTIAVSVATWNAGITVNGIGDTITVSNAAYTSFFNGKYMTRFTETGAKNRAGVYFYAKDQYGTKAMNLAQVVVASTGWTDSTITTAAPAFVIDANGKITTTSMPAGSYATITGITNNGLLKTIKLIFQ